MFGLSPQQYEFILKTVALPVRAHGAELYCYGSRARGDHRAFSDLDLMIEGDQKLRSEIGLISETLQNSSFPFKVDLVLFSDFSEAYRDSYEADKKRF